MNGARCGTLRPAAQAVGRMPGADFPRGVGALRMRHVRWRSSRAKPSPHSTGHPAAPPPPPEPPDAEPDELDELLDELDPPLDDELPAIGVALASSDGRL